MATKGPSSVGPSLTWNVDVPQADPKTNAAAKAARIKQRMCSSPEECAAHAANLKPD
jgi:hypothetical protein